MKPFPGEHFDNDEIIFYSRLSREKRITKNVADIFIGKWRIFKLLSE